MDSHRICSSDVLPSNVTKADGLNDVTGDFPKTLMGLLVGLCCV